MSSYKDHHMGPVRGNDAWTVTHSWDYFTRDRLEWLYGPGRAQTPEAKADLESWNNLGRAA